MSLKNLIVKGKYFQYTGEPANLEKQKNHFNQIKTAIRDYITSNGYDELFPHTFHNFASMDFNAIIIRPEKKENQSFFSFMHKDAKDIKNYYLEQLKNTKESAVWRLNVCCNPRDLDGRKVIFVEITSEPAIIYKFQQLNERASLDQDKIDLIIYENQEFISRLAAANLLNTLDPPKPIGSSVKTDVTIKLRAFNFNKIADFLEKGRQEVEDGQSENGLVTLRSALELFFVEILMRKGIEPAPQKNVNKNIDKLLGLGFIDSSTHNNLIKLAYNGLYINLSTVTHDRIPRDYFDSRFYFNLTEEIFDYVLERVIKLNLQTTTIDKNNTKK